MEVTEKGLLECYKIFSGDQLSHVNVESKGHQIKFKDTEVLA
jgi:hypothetical protein